MALLEVENLEVSFPGEEGRVSVTDGINLQLDEGEVLALVGESGCGKSLTALSIMRLIPKPGRIEPPSSIQFNGTDILALPVPAMRKVRGGQIAMIFQEPMTALSPVKTVGSQVVEAIRLHRKVSKRQAAAETIEMFERVGIPDAAARFQTYPHQLSGGLLQRVMIAMAVSMRPALLIADEPTTALDVTVQAQILDLLLDLKDDIGTAILLITHNLGVVNQISDRVAVMYAGHIVEEGPRKNILGQPAHPYTQGLIASIPQAVARGERLNEIPGTVPRAGQWPNGCRFANRCQLASAVCHTSAPPEVTLSAAHVAHCHEIDG